MHKFIIKILMTALHVEGYFVKKSKVEIIWRMIKKNSYLRSLFEYGAILDLI